MCSISASGDCCCNHYDFYHCPLNRGLWILSKLAHPPRGLLKFLTRVEAYCPGEQLFSTHHRLRCMSFPHGSVGVLVRVPPSTLCTSQTMTGISGETSRSAPTLTGWKPDPFMYVVPRFSACEGIPTAPLTHLFLLFLLAYSWISPGCSLEGLMLKLKLQYFGHLMRRVDSLEKTLMPGGIEGRRRRG